MGKARHRFDPTAIREYDIRGIVGRTLSADDAYAVGRGFGTVVKRAGGGKVAVGYDGLVAGRTRGLTGHRQAPDRQAAFAPRRILTRLAHGSPGVAVDNLLILCAPKWNATGSCRGGSSGRTLGGLCIMAAV